MCHCCTIDAFGRPSRPGGGEQKEDANYRISGSTFAAGGRLRVQLCMHNIETAEITRRSRDRATKGPGSMRQGRDAARSCQQDPVKAINTGICTRSAGAAERIDFSVRYRSITLVELWRSAVERLSFSILAQHFHLRHGAAALRSADKDELDEDVRRRMASQLPTSSCID